MVSHPLSVGAKRRSTTEVFSDSGQRGSRSSSIAKTCCRKLQVPHMALVMAWRSRRRICRVTRFPSKRACTYLRWSSRCCRSTTSCTTRAQRSAYQRHRRARWLGRNFGRAFGCLVQVSRRDSSYLPPLWLGHRCRRRLGRSLLRYEDHTQHLGRASTRWEGPDRLLP